jgi:hypothetical protein
MVCCGLLMAWRRGVRSKARAGWAWKERGVWVCKFEYQMVL